MDHAIGAGDRARLLDLARRALEARVRGGPPPSFERGGALDLPRGAFVSIHRQGELRGCLGRIEADRPLADTVAHLAAAVSDSDPRFEPVAPPEVRELDIEISVLSPEQVATVDEVEIGRHGLIVEQGSRRGLLLPQVAREHGWDRQTFLAQTCLKAGLPADAWQHGARILTFEAEVFGDDDTH